MAISIVIIHERKRLLRSRKLLQDVNGGWTCTTIFSPTIGIVITNIGIGCTTGCTIRITDTITTMAGHITATATTAEPHGPLPVKDKGSALNADPQYRKASRPIFGIHIGREAFPLCAAARLFQRFQY